MSLTPDGVLQVIRSESLRFRVHADDREDLIQWIHCELIESIGNEYLLLIAQNVDKYRPAIRRAVSRARYRTFGRKQKRIDRGLPQEIPTERFEQGVSVFVELVACLAEAMDGMPFVERQVLELMKCRFTGKEISLITGLDARRVSEMKKRIRIRLLKFMLRQENLWIKTGSGSAPRL